MVYVKQGNEGKAGKAGKADNASKAGKSRNEKADSKAIISDSQACPQASSIRPFSEQPC